MKFSIKNPIRILIFFTLIAPLWTLPDLVAQESEEVEETLDKLVFRGTKLEGVLQMLEMRTGRAVLRPQALPTPEFTFDSQVPLTNEEAIVAIESLLSLNGIGVAPQGEKFLIVVPIDAVRTEAPELVIGSLADREPSNKVVSKLFRLEYLDSQTFQQQIQPFLSPRFNQIIPFQNSNAVIVTDTVRNLQRLEYVVSEVDKPSRLNIETRFYTLSYAQASEVSDHIQSFIDAARNSFGTNNNNQQRGNNRNNNGNAPAPVQAAVPAGDGSIPAQILFGSNTAISSDDRTNQIIIMTEPSNLKFFDDIIAKLDIKADPSTRIEVIALKHADAVEVASLLTDVVSGRTSGERGDRSTANSNTSARDRVTGVPRTATTPRTVQPNTTPQTRTPSADGESSDSQFSDFMTIIADERSNALVISGTRGDLEIIRELVSRIDVLLAQVQIEVILVDVTLSNSRTRGIDAFGGTFTQGTGTAGDEIVIGDNGFNLLGLGLGGSSFTINDGDFSDVFVNLVLNTAQTDSDVTVVSRPNIVTTHNKEATVIVGQSVPVISSTQSTLDSSDNTRNSFTFEEIALELKVKPLIGPNNVIQLEIEQTFDEVISADPDIAGGNPVIGRREASSFVSVKDGELIILGGLQRELSSKSKGKTAILGDIPFIGGFLFGSRSKQNDTSELMLFIRPSIMRTTDAVNEKAYDAVQNLSEAERVNRILYPSEEQIEEVEETPKKKKGWFRLDGKKDTEGEN
ncbi:hypothetical protein MLD52_13240 [Puniceicoccaceae bacterium K14]|nr:hypothetical protein [Puniceicoccaceae bacterium K14]